MKKIFLMAALAVGTFAAQAQNAIETSKFSDNWSFTLKGGAVSEFTPESGFWNNARGIFGLELRKQITPVFGLGVEGEATINTSSWTGFRSYNAIDHQYVGIFGAFNLMNAFGGYKGTPRCFEIELVAGTGWLHAYYPSTEAEDGNSWGNKVGLNFNFNLGEAKAWTLSLKPAILWNMNGHLKGNVLGASSRYNSHCAVVEMEAGITYHFQNSNGTHSFKIGRMMDEELIASLNAEINSLRDQLANCEANRGQAEAQIAKLQDELRACYEKVNKPCQEVVEGLNNKYYVFFRQNSATIEPLQKAQVELVAQTMKEHKGSKVEVTGYASKEGNKAYNQKLSQRRADAVAKALEKAGVAKADITAQGKGVTEIFKQLGWNRYVECSIETAD